jgi:hypothetical protein
MIAPVVQIRPLSRSKHMSRRDPDFFGIPGVPDMGTLATGCALPPKKTRNFQKKG